MKDSLYKQQELIEQQCRLDTINRNEKDLTDKIQGSEESATYYGAPLLKRTIAPLAKLIEEEIEQAQSGKAGKRQLALQMIAELDPKQTAAITAKTILDRITSRSVIQNVAVNIGTALDENRVYEKFHQEKPYLFKKVFNEASDSRSRRSQNLKAAYNRYFDKWSGWSKQEKLHLGMKLIHLFCEATGFAEVAERRSGEKTDKILIATPKVCDFVERNKDAAMLLNPIYMPMVVPPADWTNPFDGGYLTHHTKRLPFVKTPDRNYLEELSGWSEQMQPVYRAVNIMQNTGWRINEFVFVAFDILFDAGLPTAGLPAREDLPQPPSPLPKDLSTKNLTEEQSAAFKDWKKKVKNLHTLNIRSRSRRLMTAKIRSIAAQFVHHDTIYFPHTLDFRGRAYPAPMYLNPQGNSLAKGLLEFAEGKPLGTNDAAYELAVHGANCFGFDKVSMDERVQWVEDNTDRILACAENPVGNLWWAKEADDPWCFLAFCKEWSGFQANGLDHISHIPIAKDGSCSGLQHLSAALRDPVGGQAVNLVPSEEPADIYQTVIDRAIETVTADLNGEHAEIAQLWLDYGMTRKTAKRCTMTRVYGSTKFSARAFVQEYIVETDEKRKQENSDYVSVLDGREFDAAVYLANHIWEAINETVVAAKDGMTWLQSIAKELARVDLPIWFTTLDGFPVMQRYPNTTRRRVKTRLGDTFMYLSLREEDNHRLDSRRQTNGISPNWVHANDGCHLRMTVNLAFDNGVTHFAMVHDSFGCHASDVPMLSACIREAFVDLYETNDPLENFRLEVQEIAADALPDLPVKGSLDITAVKHSEFFFS